MSTNRFNAPRVRIPDVLERGKAFAAELPIYRDGSLVEPASGTFRLVDESDNEVIASSAVTITDSIATYSISASQLPSTLAYSDSYTQYWDLLLPDGETYSFKRPCALARSALYPVVSDIDLEGEYSSIENLLGAGKTSFQDKIDEAWVRLVQRVRDMGSLEYLIMTPQSLRSAHMNLTLYLIFKDAASVGMGQDSTYMDHAREHREMYERDFKTLQFKYDEDQDGGVDDKRRAGYPIIMTSRPPRNSYTNRGTIRPFRRW
jgi:hypothetical protein